MDHLIVGATNSPHIVGVLKIKMKINNYPDWICRKCGLKYGKKQKQISTWHYGKCDVCGDPAEVTEPRDFGHLNINKKPAHNG
jgi:hypothetical protein